jgi:two-component sensor histidine kinase
MSSAEQPHPTTGSGGDVSSQNVNELIARKEREYRYLAQFERLVVNLSGRFVNFAGHTMDAEIYHALKSIGEFAEVDRSYVFQFSADGSRLSNTHEWCAEGIEPARDRIQDVPAETYAWAVDRVRRGEVLYVASVANMPADAEMVQRELQAQSIRSLLNVPLICGGRALGFVGFDSVRSAKVWRTEHINLLKVVGEIIAGAMERERASQALARRVRMETLVADISTRFVNLPTSEVDAEITRTLARVGMFAAVDRSYVFRFSRDARAMDNTHEWCAPNVETHQERLQGIPVEVFRYSLERMRRGEVFLVERLADLPAEADSERKEFEREGIKTLINVPVMTPTGMIGFMGLDAVCDYKSWSEDDVRLLRLVGEVFASALDRKAADERLRVSLQEKDVLLREVHHRVKNNMQIVQSLLYLQAHALREELGPVALDAFHQSQNRIRSMATMHDRLYRAKDLSSIDFQDYLKVLVPELMNSYGMSERVKIEITGDRVLLGVDRAIPCGLIANELVTNSLKHAFPDQRRGAIQIRLRRLARQQTEMRVRDDGVGLPPGTDWRNSTSLGMQLVGDLVRQLDGSADLESAHGVHFRVRFPAFGK